VSVDAPIFVAGLDHSGKTVLRAALGAHPDIHMVRHLDLWTRLRALHAAGRRRRTEMLNASTTGRAAALGLDRGRLAQALASPHYRQVVVEIGSQLSALARTRRWGLQEALLEFEAAHVMGSLPHARIAYVVRDPRERQISMTRDHALGLAGTGAETAAWIASTRAALEAAREWPDAFRIVPYESLLNDPEQVLRELCDFVGEAYSPAMANVDPLIQRDKRSLRGEPAGDRYSWRDVAFVQDRAAAEMRAMGYAQMPVVPRAGMLGDRLVDTARWQLGRAAWWRRSRHLGRDSSPKRG
jgi:hypothetical protein